MEFLHEGESGQAPTSAPPQHDLSQPAADKAAAPPATEDAASEQDTGATFTITIPDGVEAGQQLQVNTPDGRELLVTVPEGVTAGQQLQITA